MVITAAEWARYKDRLGAINGRAAELMQEYVNTYGYEVNQELIDYAYSLATTYGEAAAELACIMYDDMAAYWAMDSKGAFESAIPAETATYDETAAAVQAAGKQAPVTIPSVVGRLTKQAAADTTMQNAARDGAEFAWIPSGDTCAYCMVLAALGWQKAGKKTLKGGHAQHIHANCNCNYAVRFDEETEIAGYDPGALDERLLEATGGEFDADDLIRQAGRTSRWEGRNYGGLNMVRREFYAESKGE